MARSEWLVTTVWKTWRGFRRLTASEKRVVLEAAALLAITWIGLRLAGFRRWKNWMEHSAVPAAPASVAADIPAGSPCKRPFGEATSLARLEDAAARHFPIRTNCLENSFALYWLLHRHDVPATLRMGARKIDGRLEAHAWLESKGIVLGNSDHLPFVPFDGPNASMESQIH